MPPKVLPRALGTGPGLHFHRFSEDLGLHVHRFSEDFDGFGECCSVNQSVSQSVITQTTNHSVIHSDQSLLIADHSFFWKNVRTSDQPPVCSLHAIDDKNA